MKPILTFSRCVSRDKGSSFLRKLKFIAQGACSLCSFLFLKLFKMTCSVALYGKNLVRVSFLNFSVQKSKVRHNNATQHDCFSRLSCFQPVRLTQTRTLILVITRKHLIIL